MAKKKTNGDAGPASAKKAKGKTATGTTAKKKAEKTPAQKEAAQGRWIRDYLRQHPPSDHVLGQHYIRQWDPGCRLSDTVRSRCGHDPVYAAVAAHRILMSVEGACRNMSEWTVQLGWYQTYLLVGYRAGCAAGLALDAAYLLRPDLDEKRREQIRAEAPLVIIDPDLVRPGPMPRLPKYQDLGRSIGIPPERLATAKTPVVRVTWGMIASQLLVPEEHLSYAQIEKLSRSADPVDLCVASYDVAASVAAALDALADRDLPQLAHAYGHFARRARGGANYALRAACLLRPDRVVEGLDRPRVFRWNPRGS